jgi:hypothetical protein
MNLVVWAEYLNQISCPEMRLAPTSVAAHGDDHPVCGGMVQLPVLRRVRRRIAGWHGRFLSPALEH